MGSINDDLFACRQSPHKDDSLFRDDLEWNGNAVVNFIGDQRTAYTEGYLKGARVLAINPYGLFLASPDGVTLRQDQMAEAEVRHELFALLLGSRSIKPLIKSPSLDQDCRGRQNRHES